MTDSIPSMTCVRDTKNLWLGLAASYWDRPGARVIIEEFQSCQCIGKTSMTTGPTRLRSGCFGDRKTVNART